MCHQQREAAERGFSALLCAFSSDPRYQSLEMHMRFKIRKHRALPCILLLIDFLLFFFPLTELELHAARVSCISTRRAIPYRLRLQAICNGHQRCEDSCAPDKAHKTYPMLVELKDTSNQFSFRDKMPEAVSKQGVHVLIDLPVQTFATGYRLIDTFYVLTLCPMLVSIIVSNASVMKRT